MIDLSTLTDAQLDGLRVEVLTAQEHRQRMAVIPGQVKDLADQYEAGGGSRQELLDSLAEAPIPAE